jgi:hypothetical protein
MSWKTGRELLWRVHLEMMAEKGGCGEHRLAGVRNGLWERKVGDVATEGPGSVRLRALESLGRLQPRDAY